MGWRDDRNVTGGVQEIDLSLSVSLSSVCLFVFVRLR